MAVSVAVYRQGFLVNHNVRITAGREAIVISYLLRRRDAGLIAVGHYNLVSANGGLDLSEQQVIGLATCDRYHHGRTAADEGNRVSRVHKLHRIVLCDRKSTASSLHYVRDVQRQRGELTPNLKATYPSDSERINSAQSVLRLDDGVSGHYSPNPLAGVELATNCPLFEQLPRSDLVTRNIRLKKAWWRLHCLIRTSEPASTLRKTDRPGDTTDYNRF